MEFRVITKAMDLYPYQQLYFTTIDYGNLHPVFPPSSRTAAKPLAFGPQLGNYHILLVTGIATPQQMVCDLQQVTGKTPQALCFPDHHDFSKKDIRTISDTFAAMPSPKVIITTEKDASRLLQADTLSAEAQAATYALPVRIAFMLDQEEKFNESITGYVLKNSRHSILAKGKDGHKPKKTGSQSHSPNKIRFK